MVAVVLWHADMLCCSADARNLHMADFVTMVNGLCGIMSIFNSLAFCLSYPPEYTYLWRALGFPVAGLFADFFDGKVARWRGRSSLLGQELDSLADLVPPPSLLPSVVSSQPRLSLVPWSTLVICSLGHFDLDLDLYAVD